MIPSKEGLDLYSRVAPFHKELERISCDIKKQVDPISSSVIYHDFCNSSGLFYFFKNNKTQK